MQQTVPLAVGITRKEEDVLMRIMMMFLNPHLGEHSKQASAIRFRRLEKVDLELLNGMVISSAPPNNHLGRHNECSDCTSRQTEKPADEKGEFHSF